MSKILIVVDMQNDFIDGALGSSEAVAIVPYVKEVIESFDGKVLFTRDTHFENYMHTQEGANLPVPHCIKGTDGWQIRAELDALRKTEPIDKLTFGSSDLVEVMKKEESIESITFVGPTPWWSRRFIPRCRLSWIPRAARAYLPRVTNVHWKL